MSTGQQETGSAAGKPAAESTGQLLWLVAAVLVAVSAASAARASLGAAHGVLNRRLARVFRLAPPRAAFGLGAGTTYAARFRRHPADLPAGISDIDAGSGLLMVMVAMKLLETRGHRDRAVVVFICLFLLFAAFLREQALWGPAYLLGAVLVAITALLQISRSSSPVRPGHALGYRRAACCYRRCR